ncbi:MAG: murein biosynthesis integral membrane protein MurJ [Rhodospirillales bacterium]|nr:murein biosynthesis integral membrane protein MurJ [Alphaproteobacteria bacterium]MCB9986154.1 murein biosynthesis integral membrane protein MurJ [Rhodospirillales bacterium]USO07288.1 MAG: murein biosynthesis integral membrane protein MurJ [Rhodospirillales bacterium]
MRLIKAMFTVGALTLVSRVAGFARDLLTARILGAGPVADAFFVALKLPNFFRRVTAEGAFSVSFVPLYSHVTQKEGEKAAADFARNAMGVMVAILLPFTLICIVAMPLIMWLLAPGFGEGTTRYDLAVMFSRITFPYLLFMSLTALVGGVLNAYDRFAPFAAAPIFFNLTLIAALMVSPWTFPSAGHALSWGVLIAGVIQLAWVWSRARRMGLVLVPKKPVLDAHIRRLFKLMLPGVIGAGVVQINLFADVVIGSFLPAGAISHLYYADRLNQLPLGTVGIAVGTALLPMLSRAVAAENHDETQRLFNRGLEICLLLALPAALALGVAAHPIIFSLFRQGAFTAGDAAATARVLMGYSLGLPAYVMGKVLATACYARQDTRTPVIVAAISVGFNIVLALILIFAFDMGVAGIATATGLAGWVQIVLIWRVLDKRRHLHFDARFRHVAPRVVVASLLMALAVFVLGHVLHDDFDSDGLARALALAGLVGGGGIVYLAVIFLSRAMTVADLKSYFRK